VFRFWLSRVPVVHPQEHSALSSSPTTSTPAAESPSFDDFMAQAWDAHASEPEAVAARLSDQGARLATTPGFLSRLAGLTNHVHGTHLGTWDAGTRALQALQDHAQCTGAVRAEIMRALASLAVCRGDERAMEGLSPSDAVRVAAVAAAHLAERDTVRAIAHWQDALARYDALQPGDDDPCHRALAVTGNNLACTLEELTERTASQRQLMIEAAQAARRHWALAGTWLEVERAEYRLAMTWLKAGDATQAIRHAQACRDVVQAHAAPALERFFAEEAVGLCAKAAGHSAAFAEARAQAERAFGELEESDRAWCRASLDALQP
jgi:hypothetical protein